MMNEENPLDRRTCIIHTARELFLSKGYGSTRIDDIIEQVGIAKGTFYHYFQSKSEVLEAVVEDLKYHYNRDLQTISSMELNAYDKVLEVWKMFFSMNNEPFVFQELLLDEENSLLIMRLIRGGFLDSIGAHHRIIQQGIDEGVFHCPHPDLVTKLMPVLVIASLITEQKDEVYALAYMVENLLETDKPILTDYLRSKSIETEI